MVHRRRQIIIPPFTGSPASSTGVASVTAADTSIVIGGTATNPTVRTNTLDVIATQHPAAADWSNNSHKITNLTNGAAAQDAAAFGQIPTALPPNGAAGGDLSGTYPNPTVAKVNGTSVPASPSASQVITASNSTTATWQFPPGFEINYTTITANVNITDTSEATATALISPGAITFDGTAVWVEFQGIVQGDTSAAGDSTVISLFEGSTQITRLAQIQTPSVTGHMTVSLFNRVKFTPTAASHTYKITAFSNSTTGTPRILAGSGGTGGNPPAYVRFVKA